MSSKQLKNTTLNVFSREYNDMFCHKYSKDLLRSRFGSAQDLYRKDLYSHYGCVNAIEFSDDGQWLVSGGDDRRILLWNVQKAISGVGQPKAMKGDHNSNIFCLGFDSQCHRLFSAGNDELVMIHDSTTGETVDVILHNDAIYGLSVNPSDDNIFASACDDGRVCIWDLRKEPSRETTVLARYSTAFHAVMYNPFESRMLATANTKEGIALWDIRKPLCVLQQFNSSLLSSQSAMSVRFNRTGTLVLALRRRLPPVLYNLRSSYPIVEFDDTGYYNSCTMKSCCFGGDSDQYVLSGSDDFKLYVWKIPDQVFDRTESNSQPVWVEDADLILSGHRSIVNQVRYNYANSLIASSGVEKVIKFWSTFPLPFGSGGLEKKPTYKQSRKVFSHEDYINLVLESGQFVTHDYSHQSVQEDPRMMAFFDSLVQRDIEGWTSDSSDSIDGESSFYELCWNRTPLSGDSSDSSAKDSDTEESVNLNSHYFRYLDIISKRIESNESKSSAKNPKPSGSESAATTSTNTSEEMSSTSIRDRLLSHRDGKQRDAMVPKESPEPSCLNRISELITEKKREQLKKLIKMAVRTTRKKLKRIEKKSESKHKHQSTDSVSNQSDSYKQKLNDLKKKLDFLSETVNCDPNTPDARPERQIFNRQRNYRRLRFLTNQSDLVFNEVLPMVSSSTSSDSDEFGSGDDIYNTLTAEMNRMRNSTVIETDSSDTSSSDDSLLNMRATRNANSVKYEQSSSSDEQTEQNCDKQSNSQSKEEPKPRTGDRSGNRVSFLSNLVTNQYMSDESDSDDNSQSNPICDPVIHCPYKHNLCHATTSATSANTDIKKASIFKPIDSRKRVYRRRRRSGNNRDNNSKDDNNSVDNNNKDSESHNKTDNKSNNNTNNSDFNETNND